MTQPPYPPGNDPYQNQSPGGYVPPPSGGQYPPNEPYAGSQQHGGQQYGGAPVGYQTSEEKTFALIAHFGGVIGAIPALIVFLVKGNQSPTVRAHAVAALNFQILTTATLIILGIVGVCGGFFLPSAVSWLLSLASTATWIAAVAFAIIAGLKANQGELYRYPVQLNLVK